ncbi:MAG: glycosyltransferase family 4 protein [Chlorobi bacterium]|nr:glycosyltransferase family 4 protein [Chlorobiota bacterium]
MNVLISVGGRFHAIELATNLYRRGMLARIITTKSWYCKDVLPKDYYRALPLPEVVGMIVRKIAPLRKRGYYSFVKDNLFDAAARKYIISCDIFHAWGNYALASIPIARSYHARVVIERGSTHPLYQDRILQDECERFNVAMERAHPRIIEKGLQEIEDADAVIIPSDFVYRSFAEMGTDMEKLHVVPYGVDLQSFSPAKKPDKVFRVLFIGNIGIQKGIHYLLEAWKQLNFKNAELRLVGRIERGMEPVLAGYRGLFSHRPYVPHDRIQREFHRASVFVLPSLQEGSALVTYEAMACGLPSIVSENTGSVLRDGQDGFIIPIRDVEALKEKLSYLYENPDAGKEMGKSAEQYVRQFTWERYTDGVVAVYENVLERG